MARRGRTIDYKEWREVPSATQDISADGTFGNGILNFTAPGTILRCRAFVQAHFDSTVQTGDQIKLTFGLGIVSADAAALGPTAMPDPLGDIEYPWLWWGAMFLASEQAAPSNGGWGPQAQRIEVDTKAMRRFKPEEALTWVI